MTRITHDEFLGGLFAIRTIDGVKTYRLFWKFYWGPGYNSEEDGKD